jgi:hypothetical protein
MVTAPGARPTGNLGWAPWQLVTVALQVAALMTETLVPPFGQYRSRDIRVIPPHIESKSSEDHPWI